MYFRIAMHVLCQITDGAARRLSQIRPIPKGNNLRRERRGREQASLALVICIYRGTYPVIESDFKCVKKSSEKFCI